MFQLNEIIYSTDYQSNRYIAKIIKITELPGDTLYTIEYYGWMLRYNEDIKLSEKRLSKFDKNNISFDYFAPYIVFLGHMCQQEQQRRNLSYIGKKQGDNIFDIVSDEIPPWISFILNVKVDSVKGPVALQLRGYKKIFIKNFMFSKLSDYENLAKMIIDKVVDYDKIPENEFDVVIYNSLVIKEKEISSFDLYFTKR